MGVVWCRAKNQSPVAVGGSKAPRSVTRRLAAALLLLSSVTLPMVTRAEPAAAWPWSSHVKVWGTASSCGPSSSNGWGWYRTDQGEQGWVNFYNGSGSFTFSLNRVPTSGTVVTLKWGVANCSKARYFVVSRPSWGDSASVGHLG